VRDDGHPNHILRLLLASAFAGAVTGIVLGITQIIKHPLGPGGDLTSVLGFSALLGLVFAGPHALLCGGLLRLLIRARGLQQSSTAIFLLAGVIGGVLFVPLAIIVTGGVWLPVPFEPMLFAAFGGLCGALAYRLLMPPISSRDS
jgi:hypothetical protein